MAVQTKHWRFTVDDYHQMAEAGILGEDDPVELIEGQVLMRSGKPWRFTVDDYHRMADASILDEDDRVELLEGEILAMSPIGSRHVGTINRLASILVSWVRDTIVSIQNPIRLDEHSEPQPDLTVLRFHADYYGNSLPTAADVLLLIEVSDTSLEDDRQVKLPLYARFGIPEVWIVNLRDDVIEQYTAPVGDGYRQVTTVGRGETLTATTIDLTLAADAILG